MAINKISNATKELIREQSVLSLPDRPTEKGFTAQQLKEYFTNLVLGDQGALTEIDRIVNEINEMVGDIGDETIKNYVTNSIISKLIEQSPYIGLSIVNNKLRYTRFGTPNITGELDYIPNDSVFFNGENLIGKNKNVILPQTSIDKLIDKIDNKNVREYILGLNSKINELLEKHNKEIESINSSIEAILGGDAPDALNSIKELAEALKNNPSQVDNILLQLSNLENNKVDRIDGKQLSTNDYDNESKAFVDSLRTKNLIGEEDLKTDLSQFNDDSEHRLVSDEEKNKWNAKADGNHKHKIEDVNGLNDALNDKSHKDHTHTADEIGAEEKGAAKELIQSHDSNEKSHEDIRLILDLLQNRVDGIHSAISFYDEQQLIDWLNGIYTRNDEFTPDKLFIGQHIYIQNQEENDYWVAVTPVTSLSELSPLQTDKINLEDYAAIEDLKRVAFTGSYKDLSDTPSIPKSLSELNEDDNHKTITKQKLELIDTNAEKLLEKLDANLGIDEANKMLITDSEGKVTTAVAGSMSVLVDNLTSSSTTMPLTANQGRVLNNIKLDKQQGTENANKYLYVNGLGLVDLATIKTKLSEFINDNNYQTLTEVQALIDAIPTPDVSGQISSHNIDDEAHQDIRDLIPSLSGYATENFVKTEISKIPTPDVSGQISTHNADSFAHQDIRDLIDSKIAGLINGAPTTLDTLKEIADAMTENGSVVDALEESIGTKANQSDLNTTNTNISNLTARVTTAETNISKKEDKSNLKALAYKASLSKSDVGLGNVDNTSDLNKPISTATQTALDKKVDKSELSTVAISGSYNDLYNKPFEFKGTFSYDVYDYNETLDDIEGLKFTDVGTFFVLIRRVEHYHSVTEPFIIRNWSWLVTTQTLTNLITGVRYERTYVAASGWSKFTTTYLATSNALDNYLPLSGNSAMTGILNAPLGIKVGTSILPDTNNAVHLGASNYKFAGLSVSRIDASNVYSTYFYENGTNISQKYATISSIPKLGTSNWKVSQDSSGNLVFTYN